jgi:predicted ester cyclase
MDTAGAARRANITRHRTLTMTGTRADASRNIATFRRLQQEVIVGGRDDLVEAIFAPTFHSRRVGLADLHRLSGAATTSGRDVDAYARFRVGLRANQAALSDQKRDIEEIHAVDDYLWARWRIEATHTGTFLGRPATGRRVSWTEVGILRFDSEGRIIDGWFQADELNLAIQLGLTLV